MLSPRSSLSPLSRSDGVVINSAMSWLEDEQQNALGDEIGSSLSDNSTVVSWQIHALVVLVMFGNMALWRVPRAADTVRNMLKFVPNLDPTHKLEPLSSLDWIIHLPLMPFGLELCATLWKKHNTQFARNLSVIFGLNFVQGWFTNMDHSLINVNTELQMQMWSLSYLALNSSIFMAGIIGWLPNKWGWMLSSLVGCGIWTQKIGFNNVPGRMLATSALTSILYRKDLSRFFKASYVLLAMAPLVVPDSVTDEGHLLGAAYMTGALWLLLVSARKMSDSGKSHHEQCMIQ